MAQSIKIVDILVRIAGALIMLTTTVIDYDIQLLLRKKTMKMQIPRLTLKKIKFISLERRSTSHLVPLKSSVLIIKMRLQLRQKILRLLSCVPHSEIHLKMENLKQH